MRRVRVIPCLLLRGRSLVKTRRFAEERYLGDVLNAVRIFNEKEADELMILDIDASARNRGPDTSLVRDIAGECFMPLTYGGGIRNIRDMESVFAAGCEKVTLGSAALETPELLSEAARVYGSQSFSVVIDAQKNQAGGYSVTTRRGQKAWRKDPSVFAAEAARAGAGEIVIQSVDLDGTMNGYDLDLIRAVSAAVDVPVVALGGAGRTEHFKEAADAGASAVAAGSLFVFYGRLRAVLITHPSQAELDRVLPQDPAEPVLSPDGSR